MVVKLTNDKAPGLNGVPPNAFKVMKAEKLLHLFDFILEFWEDRLDFLEWHEGQVVLVPKSGNISNPNKWRGVNLVDISAKVFSSMMYKRLFKVIKAHACPTQFGSSPGVRCQDGRFVIKMSLHARHKHNLGTYVDSVDLLKAFNRSSHAMLVLLLEQYGVPPNLQFAIERMYNDLKIVLKIGKAKVEMNQIVGVRQGECMAPTLFLFMIMEFCRNARHRMERQGTKHNDALHVDKLTT